jgi:hypothetical protein
MNATQGLAVDDSDPDRLSAALREAFDYRGDVTVTLRDGSVLEGYIYDRRRRPTQAIRILLRDSGERRLIEDHSVQRLEFTGRDTAAGKSFDQWIRRYAEQKLKGERAGIDSEPLDAV